MKSIITTLRNSIIACMIFSCPVNAQNISVGGRVVQEENNSVVPIEYSTVSLSDDSSLIVAYAYSDEKGKFTLNAPKPGNYTLTVDYMGYIPTKIDLRNLNKSLDLGDIEMTESSVVLNEVTVSANNVIQKVDRQIILPTESQIKRSNDTYDLLNNMMIERLYVDPISKSLEMSSGHVQTRVNGIEVNSSELASILAKDIQKVEYIENPGSRYNDYNLGAVINIIAKQREDGGQIAIQTSNAPLVLWGENFLTTRYNNKKSEWSLSYNNRNRGYTKRRRDVVETFHLADGTIERYQEGINDKSKNFDNHINLTYNLSDPDKYTFNVVFRNDLSNTPYNNRRAKLWSNTNEVPIFSRIRLKETSYSPSLDLYYQQALPNKQNIQFNLVGTIIDTHNERGYNEYTENHTTISDILSVIDGKKYSVIGEGIYDKEFEHVKISSGIKHFQMRAENMYKGSIKAQSNMNQAETYIFSEVQGRIKSFNYSGGIGLTRSYFKESDKKNDYYTFSPFIQLSYRPHPSSFIRYAFN
ncbi:MAG: TonB-dependent receptor, partial [Bacteroides sp.]|nr:TonB-dependent receptor [Bacteroides sp.]